MATEESKFRFAVFALLALIFFAATMRFFKVETSPPGFYRDEAAISAQVICVQQSGENLQGRSWPLFSEVLAGGFVTPTYLYPAAAWTKVFGSSIASFREFTAFFSLLFIAGSFVFGARFWKSQEAGVLCALSAAISPWVFQFARIAWDPSLAPAYMVWAFALLWGRKNLELALSGVCFSLAAYCYPPMRLHLAIMMPFAILFLARENKTWKKYLIPITTATLVSLPLLKLTVTGEIQQRFQVLSVFNAEHLRNVYGDATVGLALRLFFSNLISLLSPYYLFIQGDINLRHSTSLFGVWSWLDIFAFFIAVAAVAWALVKKQRIPLLQISFIIVGYVAGLLPSALTWEGNPHALRSFGAVTFLVLGTGGILFRAWNQSRVLRAAILVVSYLSFLVFTQIYFVTYPRYARAPFDEGMVEIASQLRGENRIAELPKVIESKGIEYESMALDYYLLSAGAKTCPVKTRQENN